MGDTPGSMGSGAGPKIKLFDHVTDFVEYLLHENAPKITLVIVSTRESFIRELDRAVNLQTQNQNQAQEQQLEVNLDRTFTTAEAIAANPQSSTLESRHLICRKIGLISSSRKVTVSFCPSLEHLQAYLGVFREELRRSERKSDKPHASPILAIVGLVAIHSQTPEFSAQGLSRTFALAVEAASREGTKLILCECKPIDGEPDAVHGTSIWRTRVPILSSAADARGEDNGPTSPTVQIKQIAEKWFTFNGPATAIG